MGCNCASQKQLTKILDEYGNKENVVNKSEDLGMKVKRFVYNSSIRLAIVLVAPFTFAYIIYKGTLGNKKISLAKFFRLRSYAK